MTISKENLNLLISSVACLLALGVGPLVIALVVCFLLGVFADFG